MRFHVLQRGKGLLLSLFFLPWTVAAFSPDSVEITARSVFAPHLFLSHAIADSSGSINEKYRAWSASHDAGIRYFGNSRADAFMGIRYDAAEIAIQDKDLDMGAIRGLSEQAGLWAGLELKRGLHACGIEWKPAIEGGAVLDMANNRVLWNSEGRLSLCYDKWNATLRGKRQAPSGALSLDYFAAIDDPIHIVQYRNQYGFGVSCGRLVLDSLHLNADLKQQGPLRSPGFQAGFAARELLAGIQMMKRVFGCRIGASMSWQAGDDTVLVFDNPETGAASGNRWGRMVGNHLALGADLSVSTPNDGWLFEAHAKYFEVDFDHGAVDPRFLITPLAQLAQGAFGSYQISFSGPAPDSLRSHVAALGVERRWKKEKSQFAVGNVVTAVYPGWSLDFEKVPVEYYLVHGEPEPGRVDDNLEWIFYGQLRVRYQRETEKKRFALKFALEQLYPIGVIYSSGNSGSASTGASSGTEKWRGFGGTRISVDVVTRPF